MNTDVVVGIALLLRERRPHDFYVVVASATIDERPFIDFFGATADQVLKVPGNLHRIDFVYRPPEKDADAIATLVPNVYRVLREYEEGAPISVFLSLSLCLSPCLSVFLVTYRGFLTTMNKLAHNDAPERESEREKERAEREKERGRGGIESRERV